MAGAGLLYRERFTGMASKICPDKARQRRLRGVGESEGRSRLTLRLAGLRVYSHLRVDSPDKALAAVREKSTQEQIS